MTIECAERAFVRATPERCYGVAADLPGYLNWAGEVERVTVLDAPGYRVLLEVSLFGKDFGATLDFDREQGPASLPFVLYESRKVASAAGGYLFEAAEDGTMLSFRFQAELVKPKAARLERRLSRMIETIATRDLKRHIERSARRS